MGCTGRESTRRHSNPRSIEGAAIEWGHRDAVKAGTKGAPVGPWIWNQTQNQNQEKKHELYGRQKAFTSTILVMSFKTILLENIKAPCIRSNGQSARSPEMSILTAMSVTHLRSQPVKKGALWGAVGGREGHKDAVKLQDNYSNTVGWAGSVETPPFKALYWADSANTDNARDKPKLCNSTRTRPSFYSAGIITNEATANHGIDSNYITSSSPSELYYPVQFILRLPHLNVCQCRVELLRNFAQPSVFVLHPAHIQCSQFINASSKSSFTFCSTAHNPTIQSTARLTPNSPNRLELYSPDSHFRASFQTHETETRSFTVNRHLRACGGRSDPPSNPIFRAKFKTPGHRRLSPEIWENLTV